MPFPDVIKTGDKLAINTALREYKTNSGVVLYDKVLSIDRNERLPKLAEKDFAGTVLILSAALTLSFESMNLKRGMTADQTIDLAETLIDTSSEDYLSFQDIMLFLQKLVRGEYGSNYESMDIPKFMEKLEIYRTERHMAFKRIKEEKDVQYKSLGDSNKTNVANPLDEHFSKLGQAMDNMKSKISELKQDNHSLRMDKL